MTDGMTVLAVTMGSSVPSSWAESDIFHYTKLNSLSQSTHACTFRNTPIYLSLGKAQHFRTIQTTPCSLNFSYQGYGVGFEDRKQQQKQWLFSVPCLKIFNPEGERNRVCTTSFTYCLNSTQTKRGH